MMRIQEHTGNMDIVYFSLNNWVPGVCYPNVDPFKTWMETLEETLANEDWCKENKLCVYVGVVDQSLNFTISATKEWVEKNCPELLTEYTQFVFTPEEGKTIPDHDDWYQLFLEYCEENFGITY